MLRTNVVNALSTKQGIIFVTQGLIAQLENEAQLAFILAHEMVHYEHDHVVEGYKERSEISRSRSRNEEKFKKLSYYSREKEYEADSIAVGIYSKAGYSKEELYNVFDVLTYSYLPFEIEDIQLDLLNSDDLFIPKERFTNEIPDISVDEDYDDSKSSHPNIKQRKEQVSSVVEHEKNWENNKYLVSEEEFMTVRKLARFESIRNDLFNFRYIDALYSIHLLEKEHPNSLYLNRGKAKAWAGMIASKADPEYKWRPVSPKKIQGPSHQYHQLIYEFSTQQLYSVGLRIIYDAKQKFPEDKELKAIFNYTVVALASDKKKFEKDSYKDLNYYEALEEFTASKNKFTDSLINKEEADTEEQKLSKYEKIRRDKDNAPVATSADAEFDVEKFHLYALKGIVNDDDFLSVYNNALADSENEEEADEKRISRKKQKKKNKIEEENVFKLGLESVILLESHAVKYDWRDRVDDDKSYQLELKLQEAVNSMSSNTTIEVNPISTAEYNESGTITYNERAVLLNGISQMLEYPNARLFPVDYSLQNELITNYKTSKVTFAVVEAGFDRRRFFMFCIYPVIFYAIPIDLAIRFRGIHYTDFSLVVFDLEEFNVVGVKHYVIPGITSKIKMEMVMHDFIFNLNLQPK